MQRLAPLISTFLLSLAGCKSDGEQARSGCDLDALARLANVLESAPEAERITIVWPGIVDACGSAMPEDLRSYFDYAHDPTNRGSARLAPQSEALAAMKRKACPDWEAGARAIADAPANVRGEMLHRGCDFGRYGVISDDEIATYTTAILTWATHQWFLDQGLAPEHAKVITRALHALDQHGSSPMHGLVNLRWPIADGIPLVDGIPVVVTQTELKFNERVIALLGNGELAEGDLRNHLIPALYDHLEEEVMKSRQVAEIRGETWNDSLLIVADARTPFATIVNVMFTAGRAELPRFGFVVASEGRSYSYIPVTTPRFDASPTDESTPRDPTPVMTIELCGDGLSLLRVPNVEGRPESHPRGATDKILAFAEALRRDHPSAHEVVISAARNVPLEDILVAIAAARRLLPDVIITDASAHRYQHPEVRAIDDVVVWGGLTGIEGGEGYAVDGLIGKSNRSTGFGGRGMPVPNVRHAKAKVNGKLDADIVRRIVRAHTNEVRSCYNIGLTQNPKLAGRVTIDFVIASTGKIREATVAESTLSDASVGTCIARAVKRWQFPKPQGGGEVEVSYPFHLSPG